MVPTGPRTLAETIETPGSTEAASLDRAANDRVGRRDFLHRGARAVGWCGLGAMLVGGGAATAGFFFPRVLYEPPTWFVAGKPESFSPGEVNERFVASQRVWIVRTRAGIYAVQARCTHLGCSPSWFTEEQLFKCPCHGSNFNLAGDVVAGPAPQPLFRVSLKLDDEGQIVVDRALAENRPGAREAGGFLLRL